MTAPMNPSDLVLSSPPQTGAAAPTVDPYAQGAHARAADPTQVAPEEFVFPGSDRVNPAEVFAGPGYTSPRGVDNGLASAALWLTVAGMIVPFLLPISAVMGVIAYLRARNLHGRVGQREALGATAISSVVAALWVLVILLIINM
ncbi:hypothetical protein [Schaalia vaccimaxillae]|uniref:hypothetical protein n=1 Tax=Schaalia vaccimaxillae TaxID=183916 RepID=UPI00103ED414|nr:hypothetical protein [Schaalia vaccimaxillae]